MCFCTYVARVLKLLIWWINSPMSVVFCLILGATELNRKLFFVFFKVKSSITRSLDNSWRGVSRSSTRSDWDQLWKEWEPLRGAARGHQTPVDRYTTFVDNLFDELSTYYKGDLLGQIEGARANKGHGHIQLILIAWKLRIHLRKTIAMSWSPVRVMPTWWWKPNRFVSLNPSVVRSKKLLNCQM